MKCICFLCSSGSVAQALQLRRAESPTVVAFKRFTEIWRVAKRQEAVQSTTRGLGGQWAKIQCRTIRREGDQVEHDTNKDIVVRNGQGCVQSHAECMQ